MKQAVTTLGLWAKAIASALEKIDVDAPRLVPNHVPNNGATLQKHALLENVLCRVLRSH